MYDSFKLSNLTHVTSVRPMTLKPNGFRALDVEHP
jgi:hypothetical protein